VSVERKSSASSAEFECRYLGELEQSKQHHVRMRCSKITERAVLLLTKRNIPLLRIAFYARWLSLSLGKRR